MMHDKYLKGGSINPYWVEDQRKNKDNEAMANLISAGVQLALSFIDYIRLQREMEYQEKLEIAYDFYKTHGNTPDEKEICKIIIGNVK